MRYRFRLQMCLLVQVIFSCLMASAQSPDVTFSTEYESGRPTTAAFEFEGQPIGSGREGFEAVIERLRKLPLGASVVWGPNYGRCGACSGAEPACVPKFLYPDLWTELEQIVKTRGLVLSSNYPFARPIPIEVVRAESQPPKNLSKLPLRVNWTNFRGPGSSHEAVLYELNGKFVGRGDAGFDQIWKAAEGLAPNSEIVVPQYVLGGRWAWDSFDADELKKHNDRLSHVVPFAARKPAFAELITRLKLRMIRDERQVRSEALTEGADWGPGYDGVHAFVTVGRIIRHDEPIGPAQAKLDWVDFDPNPRDQPNPREMSGHRKRSIENASYLYSGINIGKGVEGFAAAMSAIETLPKGSVVQVRVCLRTQAPFHCPITFEGIRHFERTGHEPFEGLIPWLVDVARSRKLQLEWLPDQGETCGDCEFAK